MPKQRKDGTGSIEQDNRTHRFRGRFRHNYTFYSTKSFSTKQEAESALTRMMKQIKKEEG